MIDLRRMTKKFIMNEGRQQVNWQALVQSIDEALSVLARKRKLADQLYSWDIPKSSIRTNKNASGRK